MTGNRIRVDSPPDVSAICVTYRSRTMAPDALRSVLAAASEANLRTELIVVDNASDDGTADAIAVEFPTATVIRNKANVGFGTANNQAFEVASGRWWLLLNPDARIGSAALGRLAMALADNPRLGAAGPSVGGAGMGGAESAGMLPGIRSFVGHFLFVNRALPVGRGGPWRGFQVRPQVEDRLQPVEWISAAAVLLRPEAIREAGGFDPSIFLYGEDLDLGERLLGAGWGLALVPGARAVHSIGASQGPASTRWLDGIDRFLVRRRTAPWRRAGAMTVVAIGLALRAAAAGLRGGGDAAQIHRRRMAAGARRAWQLALGGGSASYRIVDTA